LSRAALAQPGRFKKVRDNLHVKEGTLGHGAARRRYVIVFNPEQAEKDRVTRSRVVERVERQIAEIGDLAGKRHTKATCALLSHPSLGRYVKELKSGRLTIDKAKIAEEEKLDGKYLLSTSDDTLTPEEVALGYKQLLEVERAFRTLKTTLELRPLYHRKDERIRSHVTLCWLALLFVRIAETQTGQTWESMRKVLDRLHMGEFFIKDSRVLQRSELTIEQSKILKHLKIQPPKLIQNVDLAA